MPPRKKSTTASVTPTDTVLEKTSKEKSQISSLETLRTETSKEINSIIDLLITQLNNLEVLKKQTQEEIINNQKQRKQTEEEQNFDLLFSQKKIQAEFDEKMEKEKKIFELKKEELDQKDNEYKKLKIEVETFPSRLEKATEEIKKQITLELKKEHEAEKKFISQKIEFDLKLLQQQINNFQQMIKQQEKEIQSLKEERNKALDHAKEMAITVVKGKDNNQSAPSGI